MNKLYFAYGSNCHVENMSKRCPGAVAIGVATIHGWQLRTFNHSTIVKEPNSFVEGVVWRISLDHKNSLDYYEGYPLYYTKEIVETDFGPAIVYVMKADQQSGFPSDYYSDIVAEAYGEWDIPYEQYIRSLGPDINVLSWTRKTKKEIV